MSFYIREVHVRNDNSVVWYRCCCYRGGITKKDVAVYHGMLVADQNAKLAAFASRPAVLNYAANTVSSSTILPW